jgi:hypothetical protein
VQYLGRESVTVAAGTFDTCKFVLDGTSTQWIASGTFGGLQVKSTTQSQQGTINLELKTANVNGKNVP